MKGVIWHINKSQEALIDPSMALLGRDKETWI